MKSMTKRVKSASLALLMAFALCGIAMPVTYANAEPVSESVTSEMRTTLITHLSGDLQPGREASKSFNVSSGAGAAVKVVYTSSSQIGNQYAPITVYIDGSRVATSDGYNTGITIWNLTPGNHTLRVVNTGSVWLAFAVNVATL